MNTDMSSINIDSSGYVCNNQWGIKGAWYCYTDDTASPCHTSGTIPWNATSKAMCVSGTNAANKDVVLGFKVNSGPPGDSATPTTWDASKLVGFAVTLAPGSTMKGSGGSVLEIEFPTPNDQDSGGAGPGVTVPGVGTTSVTYNALFTDSVLANGTMRKSVDPANLTDFKIAIPRDSQSHTYDFCVTKVVPLMTAPSPLVATGDYGPQWSNSLPQTVNGLNGYAVQSTPFDMNNGLPMTMQVTVTASGVGFTYTAKAGASGNSPAAFPAVVSGWGPGEGGVQLYGPYKADKSVNSLQTVKSTWSFTPGSSGDSAYDLWFGPKAAPTTTPAIELMIWLNPGGKMPLGTTTGGSVMGSDGVARTVHYGQMNSTMQQVISYVPTSGSTNSVTDFNLLPYIQDAASKGYNTGMSSSYFLLGVQAGFEVYSADTWKTSNYSITIQ